PMDRLAQDARHLHLRQADALADLLLGELLAEAQAHDLTLAEGQEPQQLLEQYPLLGAAVAGLCLADVDGTGVLERDGLVGDARAPRIEDRLLADAQRRGEIGDRGLAPAAARQ